MPQMIEIVKDFLLIPTIKQRAQWHHQLLSRYHPKKLPERFW